MFNNSGLPTDTNGWVLNFDQKQKYSGNFFVGMLHEDYPDWGRGEYGQMRYYPAGAKDAQRSRSLQSLEVRNDQVYSYAPGEVDPQAVHMILPDNITALPQPFHEAKHQDLPSMGALLQKLVYSNQALMEMLKVYVSNEPERIDKMRDEYMNSDLVSEKKLNDVTKVIKAVNENVDKNNQV